MTPLTQPPLAENDVRTFNDGGYFLYHRQVFADDKLDRLSSIFEEHRVAQSKKRGDEFDTPTSKTVDYSTICLLRKYWILSSASLVPTSCYGRAILFARIHGLGEQRRGMKTRPTGWEGLTAMTRS